MARACLVESRVKSIPDSIQREALMGQSRSRSAPFGHRLPVDRVREGGCTPTQTAATAGNGKRHPLSVHPPNPGQTLSHPKPYPPKTPTKTRKHRPHAPASRAPAPPAEPLVKPLSHPKPYPPKTPTRTRKTPPPRPASRARPPPPPPGFRTRSVSTRQGRVRKMIPVSVCGACRPEVLAALPLIQHRCDIVNTLVRDPTGFFVTP